MEELVRVEKEGMRNDETVMDSQNKRHDSVEDEERNLMVVSKSAEDIEVG